MIKDSGERVAMGTTGFVRDNKVGVGRFDLIPWTAIWELAKHCEEGALKYGERNIDKGAPQHSLVDSAIRHLAKYLMGWDDEDHLRAALWNVAWAKEQEVNRPEMQDIPARMQGDEQEPEHHCISCEYLVLTDSGEWGCSVNLGPVHMYENMKNMGRNCKEYKRRRP